MVSLYISDVDQNTLKKGFQNGLKSSRHFLKLQENKVNLCIFSLGYLTHFLHTAFPNAEPFAIYYLHFQNLAPPLKKSLICT